MGDVIDSQLAKRITRARELAGLTQADIARGMTVSRSAASNWEKGIAEPSSNNLRRLADLLSVSWVWLAEGTGEMAPQQRHPDIMPDGVKIEVDKIGLELSRPVLAAMTGKKAEIWRVETDVMQAAGYQPGDYVVVDLDAHARARSVVLAYNNQVPLFRLYLPPYLFTAKLGQNPPQPLTVDNVATIVRGVVISRHSLS